MAMFGNKKELESYGDRGEIRPSYSKTPVFHRNSLDEARVTNVNHNVVIKSNNNNYWTVLVMNWLNCVLLLFDNVNKTVEIYQSE